MAFVIKEHRPGRRWLIALLLLLVWALSGLLLYQYGWQQANTSYETALQEQQALQGEIDDLSTKNREMQIQVSQLSRSAQVDREAKVGIARSMKELQDQMAEMREELSFYKGIVSPETANPGLTIYNLSVRAAEERLYHYKLILTQAGKSDRLVSGEVSMTFEGILADAEKKLKLSDIQLSKQGMLSYRFRFFQEFGGSFRLPKGFHPRRVVVELLPNGRRDGERPVMTYDWSQLRDGDN